MRPIEDGCRATRSHTLFSRCRAARVQQHSQFDVITGDYIIQWKTVFVAVLDTRKAFDSVWIDGLLYKLYQKEIASSVELSKGATQWRSEGLQRPGANA